MTNKEKLKKIKELADAMYTKMQNLTTDTSGIRKAMEEYHQFVINEYYKKDLVNEYLGTYIDELSKQFPEVSFAKLSRIAVRVAKWQKEHLLKPSDGNDLSEPISEDLEEVSKKYSSCIYLEEVLSDDDKKVLKERLINNFKAGAKWQKEQMMSKAIDFIIVDNNAVSTEISTFPYVSLGTEGDTVKLIIINQD